MRVRYFYRWKNHRARISSKPLERYLAEVALISSLWCLLLAAAAMAVLAALTAGFGRLLAIIGEVAAAVLAAFAAGFRGFLTIVGEVAWVVISHDKSPIAYQ